MVCYEGIFFDEDTSELIHSLEKNRLSEVNDVLHCTFKFLPKVDEIFDDIVGQEFELFLLGYGNDGQNSGFEVQLSEKLVPYYINYEEGNPDILKVPHITTSLAKHAKPVNTKNLHFEPLDKPIKIIGRFGYWIKNQDRSFLSFEPLFREK